ncbi:hypothetical protein BG20_I1920 [Candidatus Nitrosarchaeum limnium BG20]|uniref:Uncharacterized protein n=1 Tax=Candidatus Nitrosarchaeum limnium BG20 TaxID=859192 RepID=S2E6N6_9ARCH|nr:hypothetical protein BG20_I1920 [Candidatus Nitrosarchaeum limnium BG20]
MKITIQAKRNTLTKNNNSDLVNVVLCSLNVRQKFITL